MANRTEVPMTLFWEKGAEDEEVEEGICGTGQLVHMLLFNFLT